MKEDDPRAVRFKAAVGAGDAAGLRTLVSEHPEVREVLDALWFSFDSPAIVRAAGARDRALIDALIDLGADIEAKSAWDSGPYSALHALVDGADERSLALAEHMVERGARIDLHGAAGMGRTDVIEAILADEPGRVSEPGPDGATPLHLARNVETASTLLRHGAAIDQRCIDHRSTPAMWATQGREPVVRFLVDEGATPDLFMAAVLNDVPLAERILEREPGAIGVRVVAGGSHPHLGGGDKYVWALDGAATPVEVARRRGHAEMYAFLLERADDGVRLVQASRRADGAEIDRLVRRSGGLLERLAEATLCEALHATPVGAARLLALGADPSARDDHLGATALHHAAWRGDLELVGALLDGGADASIRDRTYSATPLGWANESGRRDVMDVILSRSAPDLVDAAWLGDLDRVRALLASGAQADGEVSAALSPLRSAAALGHIEIVRVLLEGGADPSVRNPTTGSSAEDVARANGHDDVVKLLAGL